MSQSAATTSGEMRGVDTRSRRVSYRGLVPFAGVMTAVIAVVALALAAIAIGESRSAAGAGGEATAGASAGATPPSSPAAVAAAPTLEEAGDVEFEPYERVNPDLPAVPEGKVKFFDVDVYHHVTQVAADLAPTEVWSYKVNGVEHRGTGYSEPMVVEEGDVVDFKLTNGSNEHMNVTLPHSMDFHSAKVDPGTHYTDLMPGETMRYQFKANQPGVYMYHCATAPVLLHTGAGMVGAMVVKPKGLKPARDLMIVQQEFYLGDAGEVGDIEKMKAKAPDAITFNGYANQYADHPIVVKKDELVRIWLMNAGPSIWSAFHVIGTIFDRTVIEGVEGHNSQTVNLAPSQGGFVEFTLDQEGNYPFVTHSFGDMIKGAMGVISTENAPKSEGHGH